MPITPETFGRYRLLKLIGEGGMARVHLAQQIGPQGFVKPCVLKRIAEGMARDEKYRRMFLQEARVSALLNHPNIVQTFDFGEVDGVPYMAMELVDGVNLSTLCRGLAKMNRWIPLRAAIEVCVHVCEALHYAHQLVSLDGQPLRLVHRDVSPQNILVSRQGGVKLADFGIARHEDRIEVTQGPTAKGKPGYMSPEQAMGHEIDGRSDLFALGIVLTELISARRVQRHDAPMNVGGLEERVRELCAIREDAPASLTSVALRLCSIDLERRPRDGRQVASVLRAEAQKLPEKDGLSVFLLRVFERYFPPEQLEISLEGTGSSLGSVDAAAGAMSSPSAWDAVVQPVAADVGIAEGAALPASEDELAVVRDVWTQMQLVEAPGPEARGWPTGIREVGEVPALKLEFAPDTRAKPLPSSAPPKVGTEIDLGIDQTRETPARRPSMGRGEGLTGTDFYAPGASSGLELDRPPPPSAPAAAPSLASRLAEWVGEAMSDGAVLKWVGGLAIAGVLVAAGLAVRAFGTAEESAGERAGGKLVVSSVPDGARVFINGNDTGRDTPYLEPNLPFDVPIKVAVRRAGAIAVPEEVVVHIAADVGETSARFVFDPARVFRVVTEPPGASITLNGSPLPKLRTPAELPAIRLGTTATVALALEGYLPATRRLPSAASTATVTTVRLEPARRVSVDTHPPGAKVFLDGVLVGESPLLAVNVPSETKFRLRAERRGFKTAEQSFDPKRLESNRIDLELLDLPLLSMPLDASERKTAQALDRRLAAARARVRTATQRLRAAEQRLDRINDSSAPLVAEAAEALRSVEVARVEVEERENEQDEALAEVDQFRESVLERLGREE